MHVHDSKVCLSDRKMTNPESTKPEKPGSDTMNRRWTLSVRTRGKHKNVKPKKSLRLKNKGVPESSNVQGRPQNE